MSHTKAAASPRQHPAPKFILKLVIRKLPSKSDCGAVFKTPGSLFIMVTNLKVKKKNQKKWWTKRGYSIMTIKYEYQPCLHTIPKHRSSVGNVLRPL